MLNAMTNNARKGYSTCTYGNTPLTVVRPNMRYTNTSAIPKTNNVTISFISVLN